MPFKFKTFIILFLLIPNLYSCSSKHVEEIKIGSNKTVYFITEVWGLAGGKTNFRITNSKYWNNKDRTIEFGDHGEIPILYEIKENKIIIHKVGQGNQMNNLSDLVEFKMYESGITYVNKLDSAKNGLIPDLKIYYPMKYYMEE
ncbi:hypothetical protein [Carboxylicivirga marina]|uniref:hypothetical protein n=1 Tax=Carboxylicivirga marina TaxID=2800988 RepID=UPI00259942FC|nr:hypothetical protein [uncultured Carboxylicivirga sp.]